MYKETLTAAVEGIGHYEPLRHYAEVHLLLEPAPRGSGVQLAADCPPDTLAENWQRLILTHLAERTHPGVLIGAPLTDVRITLAAGRAHQKHTEGGDFRQATYRAVRQGLRMAAAGDGVQLLEPWYDFTLELPADALGRAMADVQRMCGSFHAPETLPNSENTVRLTGRLPVATARGYAREVAAYTHGLGRWAVLPAGYDACHNTDEVLAAAGYDPDADTDNPADSVFCSHGAGYLVKWDEVPARAHVSSGLERRLGAAPAAGQTQEEDEANARRRRASAYCGTLEQDKELLAIFERTYGKIKRRGGADDAKKAARAALPKQVAHKDAVYNLSRVALVPAAFCEGRHDLLGIATEDKLHQPYRMPLMPGSREVFALAKQCGAKAVYVSGAGSTVMAVAERPEAERFYAGLRAGLETLEGLDGCEAFTLLELDADNTGATVE